MNDINIRKAANGWIVTVREPGDMAMCVKPSNELVFVTADALAEGIKNLVEPEKIKKQSVPTPYHPASPGVGRYACCRGNELGTEFAINSDLTVTLRPGSQDWTSFTDWSTFVANQITGHKSNGYIHL